MQLTTENGAIVCVYLANGEIVVSIEHSGQLVATKINRSNAIAFAGLLVAATGRIDVVRAMERVEALADELVRPTGAARTT